MGYVGAWPAWCGLPLVVTAHEASGGISRRVSPRVRRLRMPVPSDDQHATPAAVPVSGVRGRQVRAPAQSVTPCWLTAGGTITGRCVRLNESVAHVQRLDRARRSTAERPRRVRLELSPEASHRRTPSSRSRLRAVDRCLLSPKATGAARRCPAAAPWSSILSGWSAQLDRCWKGRGWCV